jgi:uncharacterized membrane protein YoaK (UPF0700 family)
MPYSDRDRIRESATADPLILFGGAYLAFVAGFVNTVSLGYFHVPVSHMTGAITRLSIDTAALNFHDFLNILFIFFGFLGGAAVSGAAIGSNNLKPSREYVWILVLEAASLGVCFFLFPYEVGGGLFFAAFACGLQNAMASTYLGLIIRTTHMTGIVTDLGILLGHALRHRHVRLWKISFLMLVLVGFFLGGISAFVTFRVVRFSAVLVPAAMCLAAAIGFYRLRVRA